MDKHLENVNQHNVTFKSTLAKVFSPFKLTEAKRQNAEKPKDAKTWMIHGLSEYFGTILISLLLAGLSTFVTKDRVIEEYLIHPIIVGFYAGFIAVGICLFLFLRWSCDLNPAVSIFRYLNGTNNGYYTSFKIFIQILGAFTAGAIIFGIGKIGNPEGLSNLPISAVNSAAKVFPPFKPATGNPANISSAISAGTAWIFFIEMIMTGVLLFPIFSPNINNKYRDLMIMFIISLSVWMGLLGGTAAINPARGFAQQFPALLSLSTEGGVNHLGSHIGVANYGFADGLAAKGHVFQSIIYGTVAMILGDLLAPVFYLFVQGLTKTFINPFIVKVISFHNYKSQVMEKPSDYNKPDNN
ncbi:aquaporin [Mycoplasma nasistruthionis]|uniref:aquaporin n=1 Tax=Mycoplasma nasistruthionis TaxID=353852 RepID=UPI001FE5B8C3|nr:aquaporin [Mycoplasma nasistruthionis]